MFFLVCSAGALGYLAVADRPEAVPDSSFEANGRRGSDSKSDRPPSGSAGSGPVSPENSEIRSAEQQQETDARQPEVPIRNENLVMAYGSVPYGVLPSWLTEGGVEVPWKPLEGTAEKIESVARHPETALPPSAPAIASSIPETDGPPPGPKRSSADVAMDREIEPAQPSAQQAKALGPLAQSVSRSAVAIENKVTGQLGENGGRDIGPKPEGALASFVAIQGDDLKDAPAPERREPQGYITLESEPESARNKASRSHPAKPSERQAKIGDAPGIPPDSPAKSTEDPSKRADAPPASGGDLGDLRVFASDFVQTEQRGNLADQHRFYAESVHFYREGDLSWAGVAAATRRYQLENPNKQYGVTAPAVVRGPVNGGFYVVDQPISWSRTDGSRLTRGRSILRLRVVSSGRGGWKITSIEEIGQ